MTSDPRLIALYDWLATRLPGRAFTLAPASADASFRRYFRVSPTDGGDTLIAMDAPPDKEDCRPFLHVARLFGASGAHVPQVLGENLEEGFLLLEDLGGTTFLERLNASAGSAASELYGSAIEALVAIQAATSWTRLPAWTRKRTAASAAHSQPMKRRCCAVNSACSRSGICPGTSPSRSRKRTRSFSQPPLTASWRTTWPSRWCTCTATTIRAT